MAILAREKLGGKVEGKRIIVLAGRDNNGGSGLVAARRLANWGADVCLVLATSLKDCRDVPAHQLAILQKMGVAILPSAILPRADLILDALIGYGLRGASQGLTADLIRAANASDTLVIALDTPSGLDATTGEVFEPCIRADATLTLALPKVGLVSETACDAIGKLYVADISVPRQVYAAMGIVDIPTKSSSPLCPYFHAE